MEKSPGDSGETSLAVHPDTAAPVLTIEAAGSNPAHLTVEGELDAFSAPIFRAAIGRILESAEGDVTIDTTRVSFIDSSALGVLISSLKQLEEQGRTLRITQQSDHVRRLLEITGLEHKFA